MIVNKLPKDIKRRWFADIETASHRSKLPNLIELNEWLQEGSLVQERMKTAATRNFLKVCIEENKIASDQVEINQKTPLSLTKER